MEPTESACGDDDDVLRGRHLFKFMQIQMIADTAFGRLCERLSQPPNALSNLTFA
jgi:hypothetical protein